MVRPEETIVELNNGCLCCTLNDNLYEILNDLFDRRDDFDEIIIEATGVADPTGLAQPFVSHPLIKRHFPLSGVICMVDAELIEEQLVETEEAKNQVAFSDVLLINKTDLVTPEYVKELEGKLQRMNPLATICQGHKQAYPNIQLDVQESPLDEFFKQGDHHHKHTDEVVSQTYHFDQAFDYQMLD